MHVQRAVLLALIIRELRIRVGGRWLGLMWMLFEPIIYILLLLTVLGLRRHSAPGGAELPVFLVTGMLPFFLFRNLMRRIPNAVDASRSLFSYRQVKPIDAMIARGMVETGLYCAVYISVLALLGWAGYHWLPQAPLELLAVAAVLVLLGSMIGVLFAVAVHDRPKVRTVVNWLLYPLYFASGVLLPVQALPDEVQAWLLWNPVLHLIELSRLYFIPNYQSVDGVNLRYPAACLLAVSALSLAAYRLYRHRLVSRD